MGEGNWAHVSMRIFYNSASSQTMQKCDGLFNVLLPLFWLFLVFLCYFLKITNFWERKWTQKSNQYCESSAVTNSSILISRTLHSMLVCRSCAALQMKEDLQQVPISVSLHQTVGFTGIELGVVITMECAFLFSVVSDEMRKIDTLQGWKTGFLFAFESREKTLRYWIMILDSILGKKTRERKWTLAFFNGIFFPLQGELWLCWCDLFVLFLFYQFYA